MLVRCGPLEQLLQVGWAHWPCRLRHIQSSLTFVKEMMQLEIDCILLDEDDKDYEQLAFSFFLFTPFNCNDDKNMKC